MPATINAISGSSSSFLTPSYVPGQKDMTMHRLLFDVESGVQLAPLSSVKVGPYQ